MEQELKEKFWKYIVEYNPDLMFSLQEDYSVMGYLNMKMEGIKETIVSMQQQNLPVFQIEEACMAILTDELRPSKYLFIREILEEEFPGDAERLRESGTLTYELINMIEACKAVFQRFGFTIENESDRFLRYAIIGTVDEYLRSETEVI